MNINKEVEKISREYIYQPNYSDQYIDYTENLAKETVKTNMINSFIAKQLLKGRKDVNKHNDKIKEKIIKVRKNGN